MQEVLTKLASLDADLSEKRAKKAQLETDVHMCTVKLDRAQKLIAGLGGEKSRWTAVAGRLGHQFVALTGDIVLAAAQIAYLGEHTVQLCNLMQHSVSTETKKRTVKVVQGL